MDLDRIMNPPKIQTKVEKINLFDNCVEKMDSLFDLGRDRNRFDLNSQFKVTNGGIELLIIKDKKDCY